MSSKPLVANPRLLLAGAGHDSRARAAHPVSDGSPTGFWTVFPCREDKKRLFSGGSQLPPRTPLSCRQLSSVRRWTSRTRATTPRGALRPLRRWLYGGGDGAIRFPSHGSWMMPTKRERRSNLFRFRFNSIQQTSAPV